MKMKYCPECGSIQLQSNGNGMQCKKCSYNGLMKEDSIDVINSFIAAKKHQPADSKATSIFNPKTLNENSAKTGTSFNSTQLIQENKPESLKERLKRLQSDDIEIL